MNWNENGELESDLGTEGGEKKLDLQLEVIWTVREEGAARERTRVKTLFAGKRRRAGEERGLIADARKRGTR